MWNNGWHPNRGDDSQVNLVFAAQEQSTEIISSDRGPVFLKREYEGVPAFLSSGARIINIEDDLPDGIFDVRHHVLEAIPPVLYLKWAFAATCWSAPERSGCLVIDDPLLRPTYGFVDYRELLALMQRYKFSTNIAFIPWNWRRSDSGIIRLFRENPEYYSISVHGCAHTRAEFGSEDSEHLYAKTRQALERMDQHEAATGLAHDRVMVFPQGVFSEAAMRILTRTDLIAALSNETVSYDRNPRPITVADVWDIAIMAYDNFALFTRRYPWSGVENFAFDSLLGKPVIVVIHHGFLPRSLHPADRVHGTVECPGLSADLAQPWRVSKAKLPPKSLIPGCDTGRDVREGTAGRKSVRSDKTVPSLAA